MRRRSRSATRVDVPGVRGMALRQVVATRVLVSPLANARWQTHPKRTRPTTGVLPHHGELEFAGRKWVCQHDPLDHDGPTAAQGSVMTETNTLDRGTIAEGVIGAWRLVSYVVEDADGGHRSFPLGMTPTASSSTPSLVICRCRSGPP